MRKRSGLKKSDAKMKELTVGLEELQVMVVPTHRALEERVMLGGLLDFVHNKGKS